MPNSPSAKVTYSVFLHPKANKFLEKSNKELADRIKSSLKQLTDNPQRKGERLIPSHFYKLRVGDYRIIYEIWEEEDKVVVLFIDHRSKVYDDFNKHI